MFLPSYKYMIMPKALHTLSVSSKMEDVKSEKAWFLLQIDKKS